MVQVLVEVQVCELVISPLPNLAVLKLRLLLRQAQGRLRSVQRRRSGQLRLAPDVRLPDALFAPVKNEPIRLRVVRITS